jgi:MFS family permease
MTQTNARAAAPDPGWPTVGWLAAAQACYQSVALGNVAFSGLVGVLLAPDAQWATLPVALGVVGAAAATAPMAILMQRYGRRLVFLAGSLFGVLTLLLCAYAVLQQSFELFCLGCLLCGPYHASSQFYRYAAGEAMRPPNAARGVSWMLAGGMIAALFALDVAGAANDAFEPITFLGGYLFMAAAALASLAPLGLARLAPTVSAETHPGPVRPLKVIFTQADYLTGLTACVSAMTLMLMVMTATPLAMKLCGFSPNQSASVIQLHTIAMFAPTFFTGELVRRFGAVRIIIAGLVCFAITASAGLSGQSFGHFLVSGLFLGLSWAFLYVGGTTLVAQSVAPQERGKALGANEFIVFGFSTISTLGAGALVASDAGWAALNILLGCLLIIPALATISYVRRAGSLA